MKRTSLVLASLLTIALLSCSALDNSNSPADDLNLPQTQVLQEVFPVDKEQSHFSAKPLQGMAKVNPDIDVQATAAAPASCYTVNGSPSSMSVPNAPYYPLNYQYMSNVVRFPFSNGAPHLPAISHEFTATSYSASGTFTIDYFIIQCGQYYMETSPLSNTYIYTTAFKGYVYADEDCYMAFVGRCIGTSPGGGPCSFSINGWKGTVCW